MTETLTGNRALAYEEPLIFEQDAPGRSGVDLPDVPDGEDRLGGLARQEPIGLPGLSEPDAMRHYLRLSQKNFGIDGGFYPLGSCTMKHNPRVGEKVARLEGLGDLHPLQPVSTVQGALEMMDALSRWLETLCGMPAVILSPAAGAHGELAGLMTIRAALEAQGGPRKRVLVPESAHGTNPASARMCGYAIQSLPGDGRGRVDLDALGDALDGDVAAVMLTNPNTCGLFENDVLEIAEMTHAKGAFFYCDGANFNAIVGKVRPGDLGIDCMHLNLHKTFATPHGGGGPGAGPVMLSEPLAAFAPSPLVVHGQGGFRLLEHGEEGAPFGRVKGFHGQFAVMVRALAYMMGMGSDGLRQVAEDAVLNANYVMERLKGALSPSFPGPCMHECLFDDRFLKDTDISILDLAKALIDEGFHPMTIYFPLVVRGALLVEPTETESKATLDAFVDTLRALVERAKSGESATFHNAPVLAPRRRLDETGAARHPRLRWGPV